MSKFHIQSFCGFAICLLFLSQMQISLAAPRPQVGPVNGQRAIVDAGNAAEADDLDTGAAGSAAESEKDDLQGSSSFGYGYYSYPYLDGYYGGYYPYYSGYYGFGYPYYLGGYYGGYHGGYHGHYY